MTNFVVRDDFLYASDPRDFDIPALIERLDPLATANHDRWLTEAPDAALQKITRDYIRAHRDLFTFLRVNLSSMLSGIIVRNFMPVGYSPQISKLVLQTTMSGLGKLVHHQKGVHTLVWDIKARAGQGYKTFSEHNSEAPLHTDSQYLPSPEKFIALQVYHKARCGGGKSRLLNGHRFFVKLIGSTRGAQLVELLSKEKLPFLIPTVFTKNITRRYIYAPIFSQRIFLRYRLDTLRQGFEQHAGQYSTQIVDAVLELNELLENDPAIFQTMLEDGDLYITNNHTTLHARTEFADMERWLFRVRFN